MGKQIDNHTRGLIIAHCREHMLSDAEIGKMYGVSMGMVRRIAGAAQVKRGGPKSTDSPVELAVGAWVYGADGIARWDPTAMPQEEGASS